MNSKSGFTLVELMVVVGILAILSGVATPAYINYQNRARQTEAVEALLRARMDMETYIADKDTRPNNIGCLYTFGATCSRTSYLTSSTGKGYIISLSANSIVAARTIPSTGQRDRLWFSKTGSERSPTVVNAAAINFSIFQWLFK